MSREWEAVGKFKDTELGKLPLEWQINTMENSLSEIIDYRGKTPKKSEKGIATLSARSVKNGYIDYSSAYYISEETYKAFMVRGFPKKGDILLTTEAPMGYVAKLDKDKVGIAQRLLTLRGKEKYLLNDYLRYYLMSSIGQHQLKSRETGTTVTGIKQAEFRKVLISIPPLEEQKAIARILSTLDDKIETNNQINQRLEEIAQTIFKHWFVDFEFPNENGEPYKSGGGEMVESELGMIPKGWEVGKFENLVTVKYGKDHKKLEDGDIPVYGSGGVMRYVNKSLYSLESVLIPRKGTLNNVIYINEPFWSVDTMFFTQMNYPNITKYIYFFIKGKDLLSMNSGSAVPSMTTNILNQLPIISSPLTFIQRFNKLVEPIFLHMNLNDKQIKKLSELRDTLLPKLMSGELRVPLKGDDI